MEGLLKNGAVPYDQRPLWFDIYAAFPPRNEPTYNRPLPHSNDIIFLGTASGYPSPARGASGLVLRDLSKGTYWLFDCGEGTQIQAQKSPHVRLSRISNIFISHLHGDHLYGLPGLLCLIDQKSAAGECDVPTAEKTSSRAVVNIYGPKGLRRYVRLALALSRTHLKYTYAVHELVMRDEHLPENWTDWAALDADEIRDPPLHCERPGQDIHASADGFWCNVTDANSTDGVQVHAMSLHHTIPSVGWLIIQPNPLRKLNADLARSLGVPGGPMMGQLKKGLTVSIDGQSITPDQVLGEQIRGKRVAIMGDTYDSSQLERLMETLAKRSLITTSGAYQLDVLVHEATLENSMAEDARLKGHSTPVQASELAARLKVHLLILTHFSQRYQAIGNDRREFTGEDIGSTKWCREKPSLQILLDEARSVSSFKGEVVLADDLSIIEVPSVPG